MILILTAFLEEYRCIQSLLKQVQKIKSQETGYKQCEGGLCGHPVRLAMVGQSMGKSLKNTQTLLETEKPLMIFLTGYCGGLRAEVKVGDLCSPQKVKNQSGEELTLFWNQNILAESSGVLITVEEPVRDFKSKESLGQKQNADCVDMEAFAIAKLCHEKKLPLFVVKAVLDGVQTFVPKVSELQDLEDQRVQEILKNKEIANKSLQSYFLSIFENYDNFRESLQINLEA